MSRKRRYTISALWKGVHTIYNHAYAIADRADHHHIFLLAAGITFNVILFILPTILVVMFVAGTLVEPEIIAHSIQSFIRRMLPVDRNSKIIMRIVVAELQSALHSTETIGWIGIPSLLWISTTLFSSLRTAINGIFGIPEPGFFLKYKLKDLALMFLFTILVLLSSLSSATQTIIMAAVRSVSQHFLPEYFFGFFYKTLAISVSITITFSFFLFLYYFIPHRRLPRFVFWCSTILSTILWEIAKYVFALYVANIPTYGKIYGVYAVAVIVSIWLYYSSLILLLSAEIAQYWNDIRQQKRKHGASREKVLSSVRL